MDGGHYSSAGQVTLEGETSRWVACVFECVYVLCLCVCEDWHGEDTSLLPRNSLKTTWEQDNNLLALTKTLRLSVSHWRFSWQQRKIRPLWTDSSILPGEGPQWDFCIIQRWSSMSCRGTEIPEASFIVKCWKVFPHITALIFRQNRRNDDQLNAVRPESSGSAFQSRRNKEVAHDAFDYGFLPDLYRFCVEKWESVSRGLSSWLWCLPPTPPPSLERETVARPPVFKTLLTSIFIKSGTSATCSPLISIYCGEAHRCRFGVWAAPPCPRGAKRRNKSRLSACMPKGDIPGVTGVCDEVLSFSLCCTCFLISYISQNDLRQPRENKCEFVLCSALQSDGDNRVTDSFEKKQLLTCNCVTFWCTEDPAGVEVSLCVYYMIIFFQFDCST